MKNRCILSLLICFVLLYYALGNLNLYSSGLEAIFTWSWLTFLFFAIAGNLAAILYLPNQQKKPKQKHKPTRVKSYQS